MFLKPFKIKSNNQLKASEKKQLKEDFKRNFPSLTPQNLDDIFSKKDLVSVLKIETATHAIVQVYAVNKRPVAFVHEKIFFPTIYLLWQYPDLLLTFTTHPPVLEKLLAGAHLMLPGVTYPTFDLFSTTAKFTNNTPACVNLTSNKAAVAVGVTAQSSDEMIRSNRGKGVIIYHVLGDKLCTLENQPSLPLPDMGCPQWMTEKNVDKTEDSCLENPSTDEEQKAESTEMHSELVEVKEENVGEGPSGACDTVESTVEEVDRLFHTAFLSAIKYSKSLNTPILTSTFYKVFMVPACPPGKTLDIKKSSHKKLSNFLQNMTELGIIKIEEQKKGVDNITEINREHPMVKDFFLNPADRPSKATKEEDETAQPSVVEAHSVTALVLPIFQEFGFTKGSVINNSDIRKYITEYVRKHELQSEDKTSVKLDPPLKNVCLTEEIITWQKLIERIYNHMSPCFRITCGDTEIVRKGKLEPISITVAKRSGNKKVTLVDNLEVFGINIEEVASACQRGVAASTNINRSQTSKKTDQLQIQGNQVLFVYNLLIERYKVPKKFVRGLEFAPKKKP